MNLTNNIRNFFTSVEYAPELQSKSWQTKAETAANVCNAPLRWLTGSQKYLITSVKPCLSNEIFTPQIGALVWTVRKILGLVLVVPGMLLAVPFMAVAYTSEEIRLKHRAIHITLTREELVRLQALIEQRMTQAKQECEPLSCIACLLCSILCVLCCKG